MDFEIIFGILEVDGENHFDRDGGMFGDVETRSKPARLNINY